jgi:acylphosphatase
VREGNPNTLTEKVVRWELQARGRVQRVGYRDFVQETANLLQVTGKVWNDEKDEQVVHMIVQGPESRLSEFVKAVTGRHGLIDATELEKVGEKEADPSLIGFRQERGEPLEELAEATVQGARALNMLIGLGTETLAVSKENLVVGKENLAVSKETLAVSKETLAVGKETLAVSKENLAMSKEILAVGKETLAVGKETLAVSKETLAVGKETLAVGKETLAVGKETLGVSKENLAVSKETLAVGKETLVVGKETLAVGKQTLVAVQTGNATLAKKVDSIVEAVHSGNAVLGKKVDGVAEAVREETRSNAEFQHELAGAVGLLDTKYGFIGKTLMKIDHDLQAQTKALYRQTQALVQLAKAVTKGREGPGGRSRTRKTTPTRRKRK